MKPVPVRVIFDPGIAFVGENEVIVGGTVIAVIKVKPPLLTLPLAVFTRTFPVVPAPTTAVILVALTTVNEAAAVPPKLTPVVPVKFVPVIVTV